MSERVSSVVPGHSNLFGPLGHDEILSTIGNNILDLVMTTTDLSINGIEVTDKFGDHQMIDFSLEVQDPNTRTQHKQVLHYKRANFELMKEELGSYNYEVLMNNKNAEECYMILKDKIATATDHHIP
ncbi:hypothetical protein FHG87_022541 [Trinorchestia longiramus]|nr:hypothetical protein FHG87_022541 [Trinorchestia longiramus]